ncbi:MAG: DUF1080 domain-containing protein [Gemmatimonadota bacterium]|nr:DUF1080 domain-containing protein [Gemmatimonadota bacterium]
MKRFIQSSLLLFLLCGLIATTAPAAESTVDLSGFVSLFDGKTLDGWNKLTSYNDHGAWEVIDGAIAGDQYPPGKGGLLVTTKTFTDYELYAEVKTTYPQDSGLFLRVQPDVLSYQITIDHRPTGEIGGVYVPRGGGFVQHCHEGFTYWNPFEYNSIRVRIEGQPAHIQVWIGDKKINEYQDIMVEGKHRVPESGFIGIQVHPGENWKKGSKVLFRKIMIKELE